MRFIIHKLIWIGISAMIWAAIFHHDGPLTKPWDLAGHGLSSIVGEAHAAPVQGGWFSRDADESAGTVTVGFTPGNGEDLVIDTINHAQHSIDMAAYSFTSRPIASALLAARDRGVNVRVVADKSQATEEYTSVRYLANKGIPVRFDYRYAIMHNKFMVIDGVTVETGSFNYTRAAQLRNAENVLILHDSPAVARDYEREWARLWDESNSLQ